MTGANPFVLKYERLMAIADLIRQYVPSIKTIGCFGRITDIAPKSDEELASLHQAGYDGLTIGIETGDDKALQFMNKGYASADIVKQCRRLDRAGIHYSFFYLAGISGAGRGEIEKYKEIRTLLENLEVPTQFAALGASNVFQFQGTLPEDKEAFAAALDKIIETVKEDNLREYRVNLRHL